MKQIQKNIFLWTCVSSFFIFLRPGDINGQYVFEKTFVSEVEVNEGVQIFSNAPTKLPVYIRGRLDMNYEGKAFVVKGKSPLPRLTIKRDYKVDTWSEQKVKQEVYIKIEGNKHSDFERLNKLLSFQSVSNDKSQIYLEPHLNVKKFELRNSFLSGDKSQIILMDGSKIPVNSITLWSKVTIPMECSFNVQGSFMDLSLNKFKGQFVGVIKNSTIKMPNVRAANLTGISNEINIGAIEKCRMDVQNSKVYINTVDSLLIGHAKGDVLNKSSLNEFDIKDVNYIDIAQTNNDVFHFETVHECRITNSTFSNYKIQTLLNKALVVAKSGDLTIRNVNEAHQGVFINNEISTLQLGLNKMKHYHLITSLDMYSKINLPSEAERIDGQNPWKEEFVKGSPSDRKIEIICSKCKLKFD